MQRFSLWGNKLRPAKGLGKSEHRTKMGGLSPGHGKGRNSAGQREGEEVAEKRPVGV